MTRRPSARSAALLSAFFALALLVLFVVRARPLDAQGQGAADEFYDSHFHLTNYIQQGIDVHRFLEIMGGRVGRSTLFGIPLQQQWSYANSGDFARIGFRPGDVIQQVGREKIERVSELEAVLQERQRAWLVVIKRGGQTIRLQLAG